MIPSIEAVHARFDVPISCDTWRASVLDAACAAGAVVGQRHQRLRRSRVPRRSRRSTTRRSSRPTSGSRPGSPIPEPHYDDLVGDVRRLPRSTGRSGPRPPGSQPEQIAIDAGLDLGKTPAMSAVLLRESDVPRRPRLHAAALGQQQAVPRRHARPRHRRPARGLARLGRVRRRPRLPDRAGPRRPGSVQVCRDDAGHPRAATGSSP